MALTPAPLLRMVAAMSRTILIVDDDPHIREVLAFALEKAGMIATQAGDGVEALAAVAGKAPDLVILDINMPRMDGLEVCRRLRATGQVPILFLSSRDDEIDRIVGLEVGGDDYVTKPFSPREVVARVNAILKRAAASIAIVEPPVSLMRRGRLGLDLDGYSACWDDAPVALTATEFHLLRALAAHPAKVFTRDELIDRVYGTGLALSDRTIDSHIRHLRWKFAAVGATDIVQTAYGIGYRLGPCDG